MCTQNAICLDVGCVNGGGGGGGGGGVDERMGWTGNEPTRMSRQTMNKCAIVLHRLIWESLAHTVTLHMAAS
eukprot:EW709171.1.p2 GENE.EW709171.1~~EW709171.1.p2  ORF type:complete len:72 (-),score=16.93 EW709171.1:179-394(-)